MKIEGKKILHTDVLIIGGGTAGCYAAMTIREQSDYSIIIAEKANIRRSGCLAAGVNALNAYITKGHVPQDYVDYATKDADGIVRPDLLLTMSEGLNRVTAKMEQLGLVILKDENGEYVARGNRNIKINGENFKPLLADAVSKLDDVTVINQLNITDYLVNNNKIEGAVGFSIADGTAYEIRAKKVLIATGGAAGLYRPNNPGFSRHKMWYPPFNTGAGYAMGILAGAEMTTFEMRFIALRCKDTIAPTGTIAQGVGAKQINSLGEVYETKYGITTEERVYGTVAENQEGRGPCYLHTEGIKEEQGKDLLKAYLNMAPSQTLKWIESGKEPNEQDVEIEGTEPYIAQKFGHLKSADVLTVMPEFTKAQTDIQAMQKQYEDEMKRATDELTKKYTEYQQEQANLPKNIQERRQKELQELQEKGMQFQQDAQQQLQKSYADMMEPIYKKIEDAIKAVGQEGGYTYIFDLNRTEIPYVNEAQSTDVTAAVKAKVGIK